MEGTMVNAIQRGKHGEKVMAPLKTFDDLEFEPNIDGHFEHMVARPRAFVNGYNVKVDWNRRTGEPERFAVSVSRNNRGVRELCWYDLSSPADVTVVMFAVQLLSVYMDCCVWW